MHPQRIQMVTLVHFVKAQHISRLHYQSVSGVVLPLGSQPELSLWREPTRLLHCDGKYVPGKLNPGEGHALKNKGFQILCEVLLLLSWSIPDLDRHSSFSDLDLSNCFSLFWIPAGSSSAPDLHRYRANHQEALLFVTGQLDHSEQHTNKLLHRQEICASWKMGDTGDRCVVNPKKIQGQEELVSQLPMNTQITEPLHERDTPPPLTCECLLQHGELLMEMRCQVGRISFF